MTGYVYLERGIFDHPLFASNQPFSEREAFIWLFTHANFAEGRFRHKSTVATIPRGSYATSFRALAGHWKWSTNRVIRVLKLWENEQMIDSETERGFLLLTLRNYESYQNRRNTDGTLTEHERNSDGTATETNQRNGKEGKEGNRSPPYPPAFDQFWSAFPKQRPGSKDGAYKAWRKATKRDSEEKIHEGVQAYRGSDEVQRGFAAGAARWLNDDRWTTDYSAVAKHQLRTGPSALGKDTRDPASRARDIGEAIIEKRRAARETSAVGDDSTESFTQGSGRTDSLALPNIREPEGLR